MSGYRPIYKDIWNDPDFQELEPVDKLLFFYFCTNNSVSTSGIYQITSRNISHETGIPLTTVEQRLNNGFYKNVVYDRENNVIFVKKLHKYSVGGRPDLLTKSILTDYKLTGKSRLWDIFIEEYPKYKDLINSKSTVVQPFFKDNSNIYISNKGDCKGEEMDEVFANFVKLFEEKFGGLINYTNSEILADMSKEYPIKWFSRALDIAVENNKKRLDYVTGILKNWDINGFDNSFKNNGHKQFEKPAEKPQPTIKDVGEDYLKYLEKQKQHGNKNG